MPRLLLCVLLFLSVAHADDGPSASQRASIFAKSSVVRVLGYWEVTFRLGTSTMREYVGGSGSGFFASGDGYVVTNAHVISDIAAGEPKARETAIVQAIRKLGGSQLSAADRYALVDVLAPAAVATKHAMIVMSDGTKIPYEVVASGKPGEGTDVAIIKVDIKDAPNLPIADSGSVQVQDRVLAIGYPGAADMAGLLDDKSQLEASINEGAVSALKRTGSGDAIIQISASITHGNSGGPTINDKGEVIGLSTFGSKGEVQGFNFLVASATVKRYLAQAKVDTAPSPTTVQWRKGLDELWRGEHDAAIASFEEALTLFPMHSEAPRMVKQARALRKEAKERADKLAAETKAKAPESSSGGAIAAVLIALAIIGGGIVMLRRRRPRAPVGNAPKPIAKTVAIVAPPVGMLLCTRGRMQGQRFALMPTGVLVGRQPALAHIVIDDPRSSGKHVWIGYEGGQLVAIDQGTTNGTFVNGTRIARQSLKHGDTIVVSDPDCLSLTVQL